MARRGRYIPALSYRWLTPAYDLLMRATMREDVLRRRTVDLLAPAPGDRILDVGCGTATLTIMIAQASPQALVVGLDGDEAILRQAATKERSAGVGIRLERALATQLPHGDGAFEHVVASLMVHHLVLEDKEQMAREAYRVLHPRGTLCVVDFGPPRSSYGWAVSRVMRRFEEVSDNFDGRLPGIFRDAGFADVEEPDHIATVLGTVSLYVARKL